MRTLEIQFVANLYFYLRTVDDAINLIQVNKKCFRASLALKINPYYPKFSTYSECIEPRNRKNDVMKEIKLFPNIETIQFSFELNKNEIEHFQYIRTLNGGIGSYDLLNKLTRQRVNSFFSVLSQNVKELYIDVGIENFKFNGRYNSKPSRKKTFPSHYETDSSDSSYSSSDEEEDDTYFVNQTNTVNKSFKECLKTISELPHLEMIRMHFSSQEDGFFDARVNTPVHNKELIEIAIELKPAKYCVIFDLDFPNLELLLALKQISPLIQIVTQVPRRVDKNYLIRALNDNLIYFASHEVISLKRMTEDDFKNCVFPRYLLPKITIDEDSRHSGYFARQRRERKDKFSLDSNNFWSYPRERKLKTPCDISDFVLFELNLKFCLTGRSLILPTKLTKLKCHSNHIQNLEKLINMKDLEINIIPPSLDQLNKLVLTSAAFLNTNLIQPRLKTLLITNCFTKSGCVIFDASQCSSLSQLHINSCIIKNINLPLSLKVLQISNDSLSSKCTKMPVLQNISNLQLNVVIIKNVSFDRTHQFQLNLSQLVKLDVPRNLVLNSNSFHQPNTIVLDCPEERPRPKQDIPTIIIEDTPVAYNDTNILPVVEVGDSDTEKIEKLKSQIETIRQSLAFLKKEITRQYAILGFEREKFRLGQSCCEVDKYVSIIKDLESRKTRNEQSINDLNNRVKELQRKTQTAPSTVNNSRPQRFRTSQNLIFIQNELPPITQQPVNTREPSLFVPINKPNQSVSHANPNNSQQQTPSRTTVPFIISEELIKQFQKLIPTDDYDHWKPPMKVEDLPECKSEKTIKPKRFLEGTIETITLVFEE